MVPLAAKGVIIVGGIVVAAGVALYEHEPFREWIDHTWKKTSLAFHDLTGKLAPETERRRRREMPYDGRSNHDRGSHEMRAKQRESWQGSREDHMASQRDSASITNRKRGNASVDRAKTSALPDQDDLRHRTRPQSNPSTRLSENSLETAVVSPTENLAPMTSQILTPSSESSPILYTPRTSAAGTPGGEYTQDSHAYFPESSPPHSRPVSRGDQVNDTMSSHDRPSLSHDPTFRNHTNQDESMAVPQNPGEDLQHIDLVNDLAAEDGLDCNRSEASTETMSHISSLQDIYDPGDEHIGDSGPGDIDDVISIASSWSAVDSVDERA